MKKVISLAPLAFAMALFGCNDGQISQGSGWGVNQISYNAGTGSGINYDVDGIMHSRQRRWQDHNDHQWGGRPGWGHGSGIGGRDGGQPGRGGNHNGPSHGRDNGPGRVVPPNHGGNQGGGSRPGHGDGGHSDNQGIGGDNSGHNGRNGPRYNGGTGGNGHRFLAEGLQPVLATSAAPALTKQDIVAYARIGKVYGVSTKAATTLMEALNRAAVGDFGGLSGLGFNSDSLAAAKRNNGRLSAAELDRVSRRLGVSQQKADSLIRAVLKR